VGMKSYKVIFTLSIVLILLPLIGIYSSWKEIVIFAIGLYMAWFALTLWKKTKLEIISNNQLQ
jgi:threonine/homoserine/homoserine lactone efflux protein